MGSRKFRPQDLGINVAQVDADLEGNRGLPLHAYYDPQVFEFEMEAIFSKSWQYFTSEERLRKKGDVVSGWVGNSPVLVTRNGDGKLHGLLNICRHRGYPLVEQEHENCHLLLCKYHSWSYDLAGKLLAAPDSKDEEDFDKSKYALSPVSVDTWGGLVFVNPDPNAVPLREAHPHLTEWVEQEGIYDQPDSYCFVEGSEVAQQSNWKLWQENNFECYHCPTIHDSTFATTFATKAGAYSLRYTDRMTIARYEGLPPKNKDDLDGGTQRVLHFFPGCTIIQHNDVMAVIQVIPTGPESCRVRQNYFIQPGTPDERFKRWGDMYKKTFEEDAEVAEKQQKSIRANRHKFRFVYNREEHVVRMTKYTWNAYKAGFSN